MAWFSRLRKRAAALRRAEATRMSRARNIARFCSRLVWNGSLNLERRPVDPLRMRRTGVRETRARSARTNIDNAKAHSISRFGIHPRRTALQSPWQNGTAERFVGTVRRELLDHVVVLGEDHLRRLLREYVGYYNAERVHTSIGDSPEGRAVQERPSDQAQVIGSPRVGGLHPRYAWREAA